MDTHRTVYEVRALDPAVAQELRRLDDAGLVPRPEPDPEGGAPLRCCLRRSAPGERIALVGYAPLRRWAAATGADPGPYAETGPVFVHAAAGDCPGPPDVPGYPAALHGDRRVFRCYDARGRILGGRLVQLTADEAGRGRRRRRPRGPVRRPAGGRGARTGRGVRLLPLRGRPHPVNAPRAPGGWPGALGDGAERQTSSAFSSAEQQVPTMRRVTT